MVVHLSRIHKALGLIPSGKQTNRKELVRETSIDNGSVVNMSSLSTHISSSSLVTPGVLMLQVSATNTGSKFFSFFLSFFIL